MKVRLDSTRCQGHGRCYSVAPEIFESDEEGYGLVVSPSPGEAGREAARLAASNCPEQAITVED
jgi:ferredoxin